MTVKNMRMRGSLKDIEAIVTATLAQQPDDDEKCGQALYDALVRVYDVADMACRDARGEVAVVKPMKLTFVPSNAIETHSGIDEIRAKTVEAVAFLAKGNGPITDESRLREDLGLDLCDKNVLALDIETNLGIVIPQEKQDGINTVGDLVKLVRAAAEGCVDESPLQKAQEAQR